MKRQCEDEQDQSKKSKTTDEEGKNEQHGIPELLSSDQTCVGRVCVFCGSSAGRDPAYLEAARAVGAELARRGLELVWGGGNVGLMGAVADSILEAGGRCIGVIPEQLQARELAYTKATKLYVVKSMHERKALMASLATAFIALPGGFGTLEEFFEILTWSQLGIHSKKIGILNVNGFFDGLLSFMDHATTEQFVKTAHRDKVIVDTSVPTLLERCMANTSVGSL